ncbi:Helicase conserved C-terminal domain-containing protein [Thalassospira xiamenensis M-5 = DSM 17429]|uniref:DEAD/DEAH box helicase n=1 Tax=Thalassospira xiamenensis M-5 = DSM 17429 TaxID=1123366 RepID=A0AB72U874_9PROT|nr:DEAD/DEAH box helicase [Thalassospira xiamenensis]AJD50289.1 DEAD/DEAH box helicase [Thalassospira xiamenensis M-5 = DSM 17429]SIT32798.1 Helicase conserved C-terminal domain-containing protein [Thalassospira xiamenensis M-5 = DSM 17429]
MKAFEFDHQLINAYEHFSRSFSTIRASDLSAEVNAQYDAGRFWPDALLSLNPRFLAGPTVDELVISNDLDEGTGRVFRFGETPLRLHKHQAEAIAKAKSGKSFVVTTGTGSGKSLCFFVPVVDAIIRARRAGKPRRTKAIIVYPMNALANSQMKEIDKFIAQSGLPEDIKPVVKRYTGQESQEDRERIASNPPDILLTNYMMAELLLTRQDDLDAKVVGNASGLEFIILDELHTYRGRQGADVAVLVRRLRDRCCADNVPICIGTSATMASEGSDEGRALAVSKVASRLFGAEIGPDAVIDESLQRATDDSLKIEKVLGALGKAITHPIPDTLSDEVLKHHPVAVWAELELGLEDGLELRRKKPIPFEEAVSKLSSDSGVELEKCREYLEQFLTRVSLPERERGGEKDAAFLAFKLHRFISGAGEVFTTLTSQPRRILLEGQLEDPEAPGNRLYPTRFCRNCGQEYHVVTKIEDDGVLRFLPRSIDDTPLEPEEDEVAGYLCPANPSDADFQFTGELEGYPDSWREERNGIERLRSYRKKRMPVSYFIGADGRHSSDGNGFWFIPGKYAFCLCCHDEPTQGMRERSKLAGLSGEGRSSATTLLVASALEWMHKPNSGVPDTKRKLLGFTDNRQDAALQSGHFNDFLFVSLLRGAILRAVIAAGATGLAEDEFGLNVVRALGFTSENKAARKHWLLDANAGAIMREDAQRSLAKVLAHRVWTDLRRGWRFTNPSLSVLNLIDVNFLGLEELASDRERLMSILPVLGDLDAERRQIVLKTLLSAMLEGLAVQTEALDLTVMDGVAQKSRMLLQAPWAIDQKENPRTRASLVLRAGNKNVVTLREEQTLLRAGPNSRIARLLNSKKVLGVKLKKEEYYEFMRGVLSFLSEEGVLVPVELDADVTGWRLSPSAVRLIPGPAVSDETKRGNQYFHNLYTSIASDLRNGQSSYWGLEGREHTAQVSQKQREWREWRFRFEQDDIEHLINSENRTEIRASGESDQFLPALFCSPTMELGVDISALNAVYLRNVPPTPANYAQRAGRAGRSGQAAVVVTYCASGSPHDQYFFDRRNDMVAGIVRPPALDITNEELVRSHLHAVWLAEAKLKLSPDIPEILDLHDEKYPLKEEVLEVISRSSLVSQARGAMERVLNQILLSDDGKLPVWMGDVEAFILQTAMDAPKEFNRAFDRWRELYRSARTQLAEANKRSEITGLANADRRKIKAAQMQAQDQLAILEQGKASNGSDFYSYRYLATEGFLPGYNFPRLPLYAFVPGEGSSGSFLSRARFLAISEFGPRSLIYHEGRAYRVLKAKLPPEVRQGDGSELATKDIYICSNCGASHEGEVERCQGCNNHLAGEVPIKRTLRIDNVEAAPTERITANDEERVRQGFDIQTVFSWPQKDGRVQVTSADFVCGENSLLALQYANSAEISRLNKGLKRRKDQTVFGFNIDPRSGYWAKSEEEDSDTDVPPDVVKPVRIVPIVRDRKNALLFRFEKPEQYKLETIATVQHALLRGIEVVFQLEEGEILGEPLPARDNRRAILTYEATEGGAGVLTRLIDDENAINEIASTALSLMHFENVEEAIAAGDAALLKEKEDGSCVRGCYRCLLSYFNQPDHELIDRSSPEVGQFLIDLARGRILLAATAGSGGIASPWIAAFEAAGLPQVDTMPATFGGIEFEFIWRAFAVAATTGSITPEAEADALNKGWVLLDLPTTSSAGLPDDFLKNFEG